MLDPLDFLKQTYVDLLKSGWTLRDIDECDILFYFDLLRFTKEEKVTPIDQVGFL